MAARVTHIALLLLPFFLCPRRAIAFDTECVSSFSRNEERYNACLNANCFIFREEQPYIFLNENMDERPFPCADYKQKNLRGAFFETISKMPTLRNAVCLYAGPNCTFNGMVSFINSSAARSNHQWIAGGVLFVLRERIIPGVIPSTSILEDYLHIVGPPSQKREPLGAAWDLVIRPFSWNAWVTVVGVLFLFLVVRVLMIHMFGNSPDASGFLRSMILCNYQMEMDIREPDPREDNWWRILDHHWRLAFVFFTAVILLLYEVALAVIAFESIGIRPLINLNATKFALIKDTTQEYFFLKLSGNNGGHGNHARFNTESQVYKALRDSKNELEYTVSYGIDNRYQFTNNPRLCEDLRLYDTVPSALVKGRQPPPISGVWFYSARISRDMRRSIDKDILKLKEKGTVMEFVDQAIGNEKLRDDCKPRRSQISGYILFLLVLFPLVYLVAICVSIAAAELKKCLIPCGDPGSGTTLSESTSGSSFDETAGVGGAMRKKGVLSETRRRA